MERAPLRRPSKKTGARPRTDDGRADKGVLFGGLRAAGNQAIQGMMRKLKPTHPPRLSEPSDHHEREADQISDRIASPQLRDKPVEASSAPRAHVPERLLPSRSGGGTPIDSATREEMERRFGQDFSKVRVHNDSQANLSADRLQAQAYTAGSDIVFAKGTYAPHTAQGRRLLAHELVHVVQQSKGNEESGAPIQRQTSANQLASEATGAPTEVESVSFHARLAAGQVLTSDAEKTIHTVDETRVDISVTTAGLRVDFAPEIVITSNSWHHANIWLERISYDFTTGTLSWSANARGITWLFGARGEVTSGLSSLISRLPAAMRAPGYNPFSDPDLQSHLSAFAASLSSGGGGAGAGVPRATNVGMSAEFTIGAEIRRGSGRFSLVIPAGTRVRADVDLRGGIPDSLRDIRIDRIHLNLSSPSGGGPNIEVRILGTGIPAIFLDSATFSYGGRLSFSYTLATEALEGVFRLLLAREAIRSGRGDLVGQGATDYHEPRAHALVDAQVRENIEPLLRDLILSHRHAIPGMDLGEALGYGAELGDFPTVPPAGPGSAAG